MGATTHHRVDTVEMPHACLTDGVRILLEAVEGI